MISFRKYQGTGNDFIMIDDRDRKFPMSNQSFIEELCNRRFGIGADGLILLQTEPDGGFYMQYYNSDGRESSMCGNGGRCFARYLNDLELIGEEVSFRAMDGLHLARISKSASGDEIISLQMIPVSEYKNLDSESFEMNTGSPHFVRFCANPVAEMNLLEVAWGIRYSHSYAASGINVNLVNLDGLKQLRIRTYERGVEDETLSCGTGATASALSAALFMGLPEGRHTLKVAVAGGDLEVSFVYRKTEPLFDDVWLIGPAKFVYSGEIPG